MQQSGDLGTRGDAITFWGEREIAVLVRSDEGFSRAILPVSEAPRLNDDLYQTHLGSGGTGVSRPYCCEYNCSAVGPNGASAYIGKSTTFSYTRSLAAATRTMRQGLQYIYSAETSFPYAILTSCNRFLPLNGEIQVMNSHSLS